jgi:hypothetical protein
MLLYAIERFRIVVAFRRHGRLLGIRLLLAALGLIAVCGTLALFGIGSGAVGLRTFRRFAARGSRAGLFIVGVRTALLLGAPLLLRPALLLPVAGLPLPFGLSALLTRLLLLARLNVLLLTGILAASLRFATL